jgi:hypothetical protein
MTSSQKRKGDAYEHALRAHLANGGFAVSRTRAGYERDYGDLHILGDGHGPAVIVQSKNQPNWNGMVGGWVTATQLQRDQAGARHGFLVVKRRGIASPGRQFVIKELDDELALLREAGYANSPPP